MYVEEVNAYQIVCELFCVERWSSTPKLLKVEPNNEKHPPLKTNVTSGADRLKSGLGKSRSISW
jgi:hypothetical protein